MEFMRTVFRWDEIKKHKILVCGWIYIEFSFEAINFAINGQGSKTKHITLT